MQTTILRGGIYLAGTLLLLQITHAPLQAGPRGLEGRVTDLEAAVAALQAQATKLPPPAYDSGWQAIDPPGVTLTLMHNLGASTDNMVVDLQFKAARSLGAGINNEFFGTGFTLDGFKGAYWHGLTPNAISVFREADDESAEQIRVRIWLYR